MTIVYLRHGVIQIRKDNVSALYRRYIYLPAPAQLRKLKQPPSVFSPLSARVDVRRCRRGFACAPIHHSTVGCVIYHGRKLPAQITYLRSQPAYMQISELLCRAEYIMRATAVLRRFSPTIPLPPRLAPALDEMLQLSASPAYPRQLHFAINLRYRTCDRIRRGSRQTSSWKLASAGLRRCPAMPAKSISKENIISRGKRPLNSAVNKQFKL